MANFAQMHGLFADMPATHASGILYHCTDTGAIYFVKDTQILQEAIAPSAGKISKTVGTGGINQGQKFGLNSGGEMVKYDVSAGQTVKLDITGTLAVSNSVHLCDMGNDRYVVMATDGYLYLSKKVAGIWIKAQMTSIGSLGGIVWGLSKYSETRVIICNGSGARVAEIDWNLMTFTTPIAQTVLAASTGSGLVGGIVKISGTRFAAYTYNTSSQFLGKQYFDISETTITPSGGHTNILSNANAGIAVRDFGNGQGVIVRKRWTNETGVGGVMISLISVSGISTTETGYVYAGSCGANTQHPLSATICPLGINKTLIFYYTAGSNALDTPCVVSCFSVEHSGGGAVSAVKVIPIPKGIEVKVGNGITQSTGTFVLPVSETEIEIYWQKTLSDVWKMRLKLENDEFVKVSDPAFYAAVVLRGSSNSQDYYGNRPVVDFYTGKGLIITSNGLHLLDATSSDESVAAIGVSDQTKSEGQTAIGTLFGGVATVGTGLSYNQKVYFDETVGVNQTSAGYEIGRAIGSTDILTIPQ